jgi:hypothetical protein
MLKRLRDWWRALIEAARASDRDYEALGQGQGRPVEVPRDETPKGDGEPGASA